MKLFVAHPGYVGHRNFFVVCCLYCVSSFLQSRFVYDCVMAYPHHAYPHQCLSASLGLTTASFGLTTRVTPCASHHLKTHMWGTLGLWYRSILQVRIQTASRRPLNTSHSLQRCSMRLRNHNEDLHASNAALASPSQGIRQKRIHARSKWPLNASHDFQRCSTRPRSNNEDIHA